MNDIMELANKLLEKKEQINSSTHYLDQLKIEKDELQNKLMDEMSKINLKSLKTDTHNFARTTKKDVRIIDEKKIIENLKGTDNYDFYVKQKLDTIVFKGYAKEVMNTTGEIIEGVEAYESEYMTIKEV